MISVKTHYFIVYSYMLAVLTFTINSVQFYLYNAKSQGKVELTIVDQKTYMHFFTSPLNISCMISVPLFPLTTMNEKYVMSLQMLHCSICSRQSSKSATDWMKKEKNQCTATAQSNLQTSSDEVIQKQLTIVMLLKVILQATKFWGV